MDTKGLEQRLVEQWKRAAHDLGIRVTAPIELSDASGQSFTCEAVVHDFGSPEGAVVLSPKTARRVKAHLRTLGNRLWVSRSGPQTSGYERKHIIEELLDWGWFGEPGAEPGWYSERLRRPG